MIKCVIIDDERPAINVLETYIKKMPNLLLVGTATNPLIGIQLVHEHKADLVFLDIQMDEMGGIEVMKILGPAIKVIFCTAYSEFAVTSYELEAVDYLMKPVAFNRFVKAVQRASNLIMDKMAAAVETISDDYIFVKSEHRGKMIRINLDDIVYVEGMSNYVAFHCGAKKVMAYLSMKDLDERLPETQFMRVHKSYIVALRLITSIDSSDLAIEGVADRIPVSASYKQVFMERMKRNLLIDKP